MDRATFSPVRWWSWSDMPGLPWTVTLIDGAMTLEGAIIGAASLPAPRKHPARTAERLVRLPD